MEPRPEDVRGELERILASSAFAGSTRLSRFLKFVVERTLAGDGQRLKEYVLGVEVFDRGADYDPRIDSIVRVEAGRVRGKLEDFYRGEGAADAVLIAMQKGSYAPTFSMRVPNGTPVPQPPTAGDAKPHRATLLRIAAYVLGAALVVAAAASWWFARSPAAPRPAIAVLPFAPYGADPAEQALATRLTEQVTAELVRRGGLAVVSSTSAREVAARGGPLNEVASALGAEFLLEARLVRERGELVAEARLVRGSRNEKFWVEGFDGTDAKLDDLARRIAVAAEGAVVSVAAPSR
jgi:adenylate cyclase